MTQNSMYSGSTPDDRRESDDKPESSEIRADIDQTRQAVGAKIDQLQARLDPNRLKQQAQETVQEMISDTASSMTEYVRSHRDEMFTSLADAARRNPLPTALVGLGLGWLLLETMAGGKGRQGDDRWEYERRNFAPRGSRRRYEGSRGSDAEFRGDLYGRTEYVPGEYGDEDFDVTEEYADYRPSGYPVGSEFQSRQGNGKHRGNPLKKAAGAVKDTVSDVTHEIKDRVEDASQEIKERVSEVKDRMGDVKERMGEAVGGARSQAEQLGGQTQHSLHRAGDQVDQWQHRARYEGQRRSQQVIRNLEDNPLTYGALALAAGAALAILLPQTRTENRVFGEVRDQVMEKGQEVVETAKERAQEVVSEIRPELEEKARKLASEVKEVGKEVVQDAKEELRPVVDKALEKTKEEARNIAQEAGVNPDKLTSSSSTGGSSMGGSSIGSPSMGGSSTTGTATSGTGATGAATTGAATTGAATTGSSTATKPQSNKPTINRDILRGQWHQIKGEIKRKWGQLTDDDLTKIEGDAEKLIGMLQTRYGYARARAEQEVNEFLNSRKA